MKHEMFVIYDSKAEAFLTPFFCKTEGMALRSVLQAMRDPSSQFSQFPEDFALWRIGTYQDFDGTFELLDSPTIVSSLHLIPKMERRNDDAQPVSDGAQL